ncbi:MAG: protein-disulfide reductase DsbD [Gammaproteobacteria bacterium]|jgi:thiol:disulfide interchange protein DsbD|nr:protein-disulfide reductase DsbD [Gammaproteobacteria bacterium]
MPYWKTKYNLIIFAIMALLIGWTSAYADKPSVLSPLTLPKVLPADQAFVFNLTHDDISIRGEWQIAPNCYLYQKSVMVTLIRADGEEIPLVNSQMLPEATTINDPYFGEQTIYRHSLIIPISLASYLQSHTETINKLQVAYQGCSESGFCYPPVTKMFDLSIAEHHIQQILPVTEPTEVTNKNVENKKEEKDFTIPAAPDLEQTQQEQKFFTSIATFYLIGILLTFTPCVWPMIPILFGIIVGQKHLNTRKAFWLSLCYVLSMAFTYAIAGIIAATLGKNLQASLQQPAVIITFASLFTLLGLVQLGLVRINLPHHLRLKDILTALHAKQESGTYLGAAIMGVLATLISSPCVTAPLITALGYISQSGNVVLGGSALLALGLGMGTVLLALGTIGARFLPKSGPWMHHVNQVFSIVMFGLSIWLLGRIYHNAWILVLWGILSLFIAWCMNTFRARTGWSGRIGMIFVFYSAILFWGAIQGEQNPAKLLSFNPWKQGVESTNKMAFENIDSIASFEEMKAKTQKLSKPMMLVFYADWCISCQHLEHEVFNNSVVQKGLKSWQVVRADVSSYNEVNQQLLKHFDLIGPPAVLFFDEKGSELKNYRIIGEISVKHFLAKFNAMQPELKGT